MNHNAHFEATKNAREIEGHLKGEIEELRATTDKLDTEIRSLVSKYLLDHAKLDAETCP